jgi:phenylalanyl-tRNA synthetase alpha chain
LDYLKNIENAKTSKELENVKIAIFGKKGFLSNEFGKMKEISNEQKANFAKELNILKQSLTKAYDKKNTLMQQQELMQKFEKEKIDVTTFDYKNTLGAIHPVSATLNKIIDYFARLNFSIEQGPIIEDEFHNFEALNLPVFHPARDMQDTFYCNDGNLLRTHTSPAQIRKMKTTKPPIKMIAYGNVFRRDFDITHTPMFTQVEGLVVANGDKISFANLKHDLSEFLKYMFGNVKVRFRSSYFPFTEPSAEVDISCSFCEQKGCQVCSQTGWLEILGSGVVNQNVFKKVGYNQKVSGYAFGIGVERIAMLTHNIKDLRSLFENDIRLLEQFR